MSEKPSRRLLDRVAGVPSLIVAGAKVVGDIETPGPLMLGGSIRGDGNVLGELSIGPEAHWEGEVHAASAVVVGRITGAIIVTDRIEIAASAVIHGRVTARKIAMARGATIDGEVTVTGGEPVVQFEEKRKPPKT
jgi:cytoskeletal protein CcmA (bactofilin family)